MLPGFVTAVAGVLLASWYLGLLDRLGEADRTRSPVRAPTTRPTRTVAAADGSVLAAAAGLGAVAAAGGALGQALGRGASPEAVDPAGRRRAAGPAADAGSRARCAASRRSARRTRSSTGSTPPW